MSNKAEELSDYAKKRLENIARNEAILRELSLFGGFVPKSTIKQKKRKRQRMVEPGQERRSARLQGKTVTDDGNGAADVEHSMLSDDNDNFIEDEPRPKKRVRKLKLDSYKISHEEREALEKNLGHNFLESFREFLVHIDEITPDNVRGVMRQVTKLASGEGVRYESKKYGWAEGCYFRKGKPVTPSSDIVGLMEEAQQCENDWGEDRGHGWLLRHPLKKLLLFQQYCLHHPEFLNSKPKPHRIAAAAVEGKTSKISCKNKMKDSNGAKSKLGESAQQNLEPYYQIGDRLRKKFNHKYYEGTITEIPEPPDRKYYHVKYEDDDEEDMSVDEIKAYIIEKKHSAAATKNNTATSCGKRKNDATQNSNQRELRRSKRSERV